MPGPTRADLLIGRVGRQPAGIAHGRRVNTRLTPKESLNAPKTPHTEHRFRQTHWVGWLQWHSQHRVILGNRHGGVPTRESSSCVRQRVFTS